MNDDAKEANKSSDPMGALMERRKYQGQSFGSAFREARKSGEKTFFWKGTKFTTDLDAGKASGKASAPAGSAPALNNSRGVRASSDEDFGREGRREAPKPAVDMRADRGMNRAPVSSGRGVSPGRGMPEPAPDMRAARGMNRAPGYKLSDVERPGTNVRYENEDTSDMAYKKGGKVKAYAKGGAVRGGGCETKGKTKGRMV